MQNLAFSLGGLFWRDLERHHPGIDSLHLSPEVAAAWKQRVDDQDPPGHRPERCRSARSGNPAPPGCTTWPRSARSTSTSPSGRWRTRLGGAPWAAPCPIRPEDLARQKTIRARKSRMDQRTRERLPVLPVLVAHLQTARTDTAARLPAAQAAAPGASFTVAGVTLRRVRTAATASGSGPTTRRTGKRRDLTGEEDRAFWTWAAVETLRHTGIRIEELTELSHHSLIQYTLPSTGELVPLLQIAPSKTDTERLLVISPELADVLAAIIRRVRGAGRRRSAASPPTTPTNASGTHRCRCCSSAGSASSTGPSPPPRSATGSTGRSTGTGVTDAGRPAAAVHPARLPATVHHRRRPARHATRTSPNSSPDTATSTPPWDTRPSTPTRSSTGTAPSSPAAGRCAPARNTGYPTEQEWEEFLGHFERRKVALGTCGRSYATPCIHEHACLRCPLLRPDPAQRTGSSRSATTCIARIAEARHERLARRSRRPADQPQRRPRETRPTRPDRAPTRPASTSACRPSCRSPDAPARLPTPWPDGGLTEDGGHQLQWTRSSASAENKTRVRASPVVGVPRPRPRRHR